VQHILCHAQRTIIHHKFQWEDTMTDKDPLISAWFGVDFGDGVVGAFRECTGLGSENEGVESKASGPDGKTSSRRSPVA
jgi:hypothetical protein